MKRQLTFTLIILVLAVLACNAPAVGDDSAESEQAQEATLPVGQTTVSTHTPAAGDAGAPAGNEAEQPAGDSGEQPAQEEPTEAPIQYTDYATFEADLMNAIVYREYEKLQEMMGDSFSITGWRSEPTEMTPAEAVGLLQNYWLLPTGDVYYELGEDLSTLLGGYNPQMYWPSANIVSHARFTGWGVNGTTEAMVFINKDAQGVYTWHSVALTQGGFEAMRNIGPNGGFLTGAIDAATLPKLSAPGGGVVPPRCEENPTGPAIRLVTITGLEHHALCLYNFPATVDSPAITLELTSPRGVTFRDTYSFSRTDYGIELIGAAGTSGGWVQSEESFGSPGLPTVPEVSISAAANVPTGPWTVNVSTADGSGSVQDATVTLTYDGPFALPVQDLIHNPLERARSDYTTGEVALIAGAGYPANTEITVAIYYYEPEPEVDEGGMPYAVPRYAAKVTTDSAGTFLLEFVVGENMTRGDYHVVAKTEFKAGDWIDPIVGRLHIE
jgi:hypothetical protein